MSRARATLVLLLLTPAWAWAQHLGDEVALIPVVLSPTGPEWSGVSERVYGDWDFTKWLSARLDVTVSKLTPPPALPGTPFAAVDGWTGVGVASVDVEPSERWTLHAEGSFSPPSTMEVPLLVGTREARLQARSDSYGAAAIASYDSGGDSALEWSADLLGGWTHYDTTQRIDALEGPTGPQSAARIRTECKGVRTAACKTLLAAIKANTQALDQGRLGVVGTLTFFEHTDLTAGFTAYAYAQDPNTLGDFRAATLGRVSGSSAAPLAPQAWSTRLEVTQRVGPASLTAGWTHSLATGDNGFTDGAVLKAKFKVGDWRLWLGVSGYRDVDGSGLVTPSVGALVGARYRWP